MSAESEDTPDAGPALQQVLEYHEITKHHVQGYARGPGYLDWATQPNPFRRYHGTRRVPLEKIPVTAEPLYDDVGGVDGPGHDCRGGDGPARVAQESARGAEWR